ncbi:putative baseplate assembly protein [Amycolatopsis taiwanensis]|uniref:putative baseplate assembly protein n=1 Tax=Amycolatopsis taiwanensis TaxID=342230 RepID=UPI000482FE10|nr:putative baseplate assembly protein [Amycolatopsis taiwanensis]
MVLPAPNLDDRRFQDLVDDAKRYIQQNCPEWTDHNVSDPGVTLIEAFAYLMDQLLYRFNRVPERHYLRFLDLIGVRLVPPVAARSEVTFWLSAPRPEPVVIKAGTEVAGEVSEVDEQIVFTTDEELSISPVELSRVATIAAGETEPVDRSVALAGAEAVRCFGTAPAAGDLLLFGLSEAAPRAAVLLRLDCAVDGIGVDPTDPPLVWEAWTADGWQACELDRDSTGGFNRPGDVVLHLPPGHTTSVLARRRAGWLRCRLVEPAPGQPFYRESPQLSSATAATIGGTVGARHAEPVTDSELGISDGTPGQRFALPRTPVLGEDGPLRVLVSDAQGWQEWQEVDSFAESTATDRHLTLDRVAGEVCFGPAIRRPDGSIRGHGAIPPQGAVITVPRYRIGGGRRGNVGAGVLNRARDPIPFVYRVTNRRPAAGGVDGEAVADAAVRGPLLLRTRDRAVTPTDYEFLARAAARELARVRCVPAEPDSNAVRVLVIPHAGTHAGGRILFPELDPSTALLQRVTGYLDQRRPVGTRLIVEPPFYQGITVVATLQPTVRADADALRDAALATLYEYLSPLDGGPEGTGWPFGRAVQAGELYAVLQRLSGVDMVTQLRLFPADPVTGRRGEPTDRIGLAHNAVTFPFEHQVRVEVHHER